jgi:hypothetical protein
MKKLALLSLPMLILAAGAASAQRQLAPGQFYSGLTESGAEALAAQARETFVGAMVVPSYDVGLGTWTVDIRVIDDFGGNTDAQ